MIDNAIKLLKSAKESAVKNRAAAVQKISKQFDDEIAAYNKAISQLSGTPAKKVAKKKAAPKKPGKKAMAKKATPGKKVAPKKSAPKKKGVPAKKAAVKKASSPAAPGSFPKDGTVIEKLIFVIGETKRFISINEIADLVKKHEPASKTADIKKRFSKHMDKFRKQGKIVSYHDKESNRFYYGLPEYIKEGKPMKGHEHTPGQVK